MEAPGPVIDHLGHSQSGPRRGGTSYPLSPQHDDDEAASTAILVDARHRAATVLGDALVAVEPAADPTAVNNGSGASGWMLHLRPAELAKATGECRQLDSLRNRFGVGAQSSQSVNNR